MKPRVRPCASTWAHRQRVLLRPFVSRDQLKPCLYVAGDLAHFQLPALEAMATALDYQAPGDDGRMHTYRRLDGRWMTFLARRMQVAAERGPIHPQLAQRWAAIVAWAEHRWTSDRVRIAIAQHPDARYRAPALPAAA